MELAWPQRPKRPENADQLVAAGLAVWALFDVPWWWRPPGHGGSALGILGTVGLAAAQSLPFLRRRQWPAAVLAMTGAALAVKFVTHHNLWSAGAAVLTAAYGLGAYGGQQARKMARLGVGAAIIAAIVSLQAYGGSHAPAIACALLGTALALGEVTASHRDLAASAARQAHDEERASLAREIHDVVAHQLSAIAVQAGAARFASADDPQAAIHAVAAIEQGARHGLAELNELVRHLRRAGSPDHPGDVQRSPAPLQPSLGDVPGLIERARDSGLRAELLVEGDARSLSEAVELAGYRVIQESLTNAIRHAAGTSATVRLRYCADGIAIQVADRGAAAVPGAEAGPGGGTGLAGLTERVSLLGGWLEAGRQGGGFVVRAFLPSRS